MIFKTTSTIILSTIFLQLNLLMGQAFVTKWETSIANETIWIPTAASLGYTYDYDIDWGDGYNDKNVTGDISHSYTIPGSQQITITRVFPRIYFNSGISKNKILSIEQWGDIQWESMAKAFWGCSNLQIEAADSPDLSNVNSFAHMFHSCTNLTGTNITGNSYINDWNTSQVVDMSYMFDQARNFNAEISNWNTSNVENMSHMFDHALRFNKLINFNLASDTWNTSNVKNMSYMFSNATDFNRTIGGWNTSEVTNMLNMFKQATNFNQITGTWNTSKVTNMSGMFEDATNFNKDLNIWNTEEVTTMINMFKNAAMFDGDIRHWNTSNVSDMSFMFSGATNFNQDLSYKSFEEAWNTSEVLNMESMFRNASSFNEDIENWNTSKVTDMSNMFNGATMFDHDISYKSGSGAWNTAEVTDMRGMFAGAHNFSEDISNWNTTKVMFMQDMFKDAFAFNEAIGNWNVSAVRLMDGMLNNAQSFDQNLENWDFSSTANLIGIDGMLRFSGLSIINYDKLLQSWVDQNLMNKNLGTTTGLTYCNYTAFDQLTQQMGWTINGSTQGAPHESHWTHFNANWYDDENIWYNNAFPTLCSDVFVNIFTILTIQPGRQGVASTLEVQLGATLDIPLGAELIVNPQN